jgi:hypothetical protein
MDKRVTPRRLFQISERVYGILAGLMYLFIICLFLLVHSVGG